MDLVETSLACSVSKLNYTIDTVRQGVSLAVLKQVFEMMPYLRGLYTGSSYGKKGVQNRVRNNHQNPNYRARNPKALYAAMEERNTTTDFCLLMAFDTKAHTGWVLLCEAIWANMTGSYQTSQTLDLRAPSLAAVMPYHALNRSDPVGFPKGFGDVASQETKLVRMFKKAQMKSPYRVWQKIKTKMGIKWDRYLVHVGHLQFTVPINLARNWRLDKEPYVDIEFQVSVLQHPYQFATSAISSDAASRLGMLLSHKVDGEVQFSWLQKDEVSFIAVGNSLVDWLTGKILNPVTHQWPADRYPFIGPQRGSLKLSSWDAMFADRTERSLLELKSRKRRRDDEEAMEDTPAKVIVVAKEKEEDEDITDEALERLQYMMGGVREDMVRYRWTRGGVERLQSFGEWHAQATEEYLGHYHAERRAGHRIQKQ